MKPSLFALTLHRPWAAVVVAGPKDVENRRWAPPPWIIGKTIAIHAGKTYDHDGAFWIRDKLAELGLPQFTESSHPELVELFAATMAVVGVATVRGSCRPTKYEPSRPWHMREQYGWILTDRRPLATPIPVRGYQKLWRLPDDVRAAIEAQL